MTDLVTVIVPYFKKKKFLKKCVNSIQRQSYKNIEVIIIYDDPEMEDLNYVKTLTRIKNFSLIINKKNLGAGKSRNLGIKIAKGKYISFLDSDDYWKKDKVKVQINFMKKNNLSFSHTNYYLVDEKDKILGLMNVKKKLNYQDLIKSCDIGLSTVMIKKELLKGNSFSKYKTKEDYSLWLKIAKKNVKILGIKKNLVYWRKTKGSLSSNLWQKLTDAFKVYYSENGSIFSSLVNVGRLSINFIFKKIKQKTQIKI